jgi:hypothetical protein
MDQLRERLDALERRTHTVERRLCWWRGLACGLAVLAVLTWLLSSSKAVDAQSETLTHRLSALPDVLETLEGILRHVKVVTTPDGLKEVVITGANLRIVNGLGSTDCFDENLNPIPDCPNGLGNLIVGYNEPFVLGENIRTGSHNVVVGEGHSFSRFGGLVVGRFNTISGVLAAVSGGEFNTASGPGAVVSGGVSNTASGNNSAVIGGIENTANGDFVVISGGEFNTASGFAAVVGGGNNNTASGGWSTVSGGQSNTASGNFASVSGGGFNPLTEEGAGNTASGDLSSVSGGSGNTARGEFSSVSGGQNLTQEIAFGWAAGSEGDEVVVGNFRSP